MDIEFTTFSVNDILSASCFDWDSPAKRSSSQRICCIMVDMVSHEFSQDSDQHGAAWRWAACSFRASVSLLL